MVQLRRHGFTVVELLVVIVVVAILTVVGLVTYDGLKTSAYNTKVIAGVNQYHEAIEV